MLNDFLYLKVNVSKVAVMPHGNHRPLTIQNPAYVFSRHTNEAFSPSLSLANSVNLIHSVLFL